MNKFLKNIGTIVGVAAGIATLIGLYLNWEKNYPIIDIKSISIESLTNIPSVDGLSATYIFKDSVVNNVWKASFLIENTGSEVIVAKGNRKNIISDVLTIEIEDGFRVLNSSIKGKNFPIEIEVFKQTITTSFLQWKPKEYFELSFYLEKISSDSTETPRLYINEREILDGSVVYSTLKDPSNQKKIIADYLPTLLKNILWWLCLITIGILLVLLPTTIYYEIYRNKKANDWVENWEKEYDNWIQQQVQDQVIDKWYSPRELPVEFWHDFPGDIPDFPYNFNNISNPIIGALLIGFLATIPLLWMLKI